MLYSEIKSLPLLHRGKVRDLYAVNDETLLVIQTDRLSAFDVILDDPIPNKGRVLTAMSQFWFDKLAHVLPNHLTGIAPESVVAANEIEQVAGRAMVVKRLQPLKIEAIVRGYLIGSGWADYQKNGAVCGIPLPAGLKQAQKLPQVMFTPSTKADAGAHDENINFYQASQILGPLNARTVRDAALKLYGLAAEYAATKGIIIADTKFEFGIDKAGVVHVIDEVLTPDSSRFWPTDEYQIGISPPSFDKQFVRDWLEKQSWNKKAPAPRVPAEILQQTADKYAEALKRLTTD